MRPLALADYPGGVLIQFDNGGFACCHPWPQFGQAPLDEQIACLKKGKLTPLLIRSLACAKIDGEAREKDQWLFKGKRLPKSYTLLETLDIEVEGDIKVKGDLQAINSFIKASRATKIRIDCNFSTSEQTLTTFLEQHQGNPKIAYIEDPIPYNSEKWLSLQQKYRIPFAVDWALGDAAPYRIVKPAREAIPMHSNQHLVVTHSLEHPLGRAFAAYEALKYGITDVGLSGLTLEPGTGLGFDETLSQLTWRPL
ncbi:MAG: hypothetical protein KDK65_02750 [Chlamydiia bacterium]|nr:hypothetical protein [Chlamydiia bacterium]